MITMMLTKYGIASNFDLNLFKVRNKDLDNYWIKTTFSRYLLTMMNDDHKTTDKIESDQRYY